MKQEPNTVALTKFELFIARINREIILLSATNGYDIIKTSVQFAVFPTQHSNNVPSDREGRREADCADQSGVCTVHHGIPELRSHIFSQIQMEECDIDTGCHATGSGANHKRR